MSLFDYEGINHISDSVPVFPLGEGAETALRSIANYPINTELYEIETIGSIVSFFSNFKPSGNKKDIWDKKLLHTAIFVEDLIELEKNGFIIGVKPITKFKYDLNLYSALKKSGCEVTNDGDLIFYVDIPNLGFQKYIHPKPIIENYVSNYLSEPWDEKYRYELINEYETGDKLCIEIDNFIQLTEKGYSRIKEIAREYILKKEIETLVEPLIKIGYLDTAVREVAVLLESKLKQFHNCNKFGENLIDFHIDECIKANDGINNAGLKVYRQELRTMNRFVRNEFMHNKFSITEDNLRFLLMRQDDVFDMMEQAFEKLKTVYNQVASPPSI